MGCNSFDDSCPRPGDTDNNLLRKIAILLSESVSSDSLEATLLTRATEATLLTRATEATLLTRATEATALTLAKETTLQSLLNADAKDFWFEASVGNIPGVTFHRFTGLNPDVDILSVPEDVWELGGLFPFQSTAQSLEVLSSSAADTGAGTGARTVFVVGLNALFVEQSETVTLNGVTPVALVNSYLRVNRFLGTSAGSGETNAGNITLRVAGAGATQAFIGIGSGNAHRSIYTVPAGFTARVMDLHYDLVRTAAPAIMEVHMNVRSATGNGIWVQRFLAGAAVQGTGSFVDSRFLFSIAEKSDIRLTVSFVSDNNSRVIATGVLAITDNAIWP